jgi:hypothetical protein
MLTQGETAMFLVDFMQHLKRYERDRLPELRSTIAATNAQGDLVTGLLFAYRERNGADLMLDSRQIGSISLDEGQIVYDPKIEISEGLSLGSHLDRWVGKAWQRAGAPGAD